MSCSIISILQGIDALSHENPRYITSPSLTFKHGETIVKCITLYFSLIFKCNFSKPVAPKLLIKQIWEKEFFMKIDIFGQNWQKLPKHKSVCFNFHPFFNKSKSIENENILFPQMIKVCPKKFPPFKRKNGFLAIFVIFSKITKMAKYRFFL